MRTPAIGNRKINKQIGGFCPKLFVLLRSFCSLSGHSGHQVTSLGILPQYYFCLVPLSVLPPILIVANE